MWSHRLGRVDLQTSILSPGGNLPISSLLPCRLPPDDGVSRETDRPRSHRVAHLVPEATLKPTTCPFADRSDNPTALEPRIELCSATTRAIRVDTRPVGRGVVDASMPGEGPDCSPPTCVGYWERTRPGRPSVVNAVASPAFDTLAGTPRIDVA